MSRAYFLGAGIHTCLGRGVQANIDAMLAAPPHPQITNVPLGEGFEATPTLLLSGAPLEDIEHRLWRVIEGVVFEAFEAAGLSETEQRETVLLLGSSSVDIAASEAIYQRDLRDGHDAHPLTSNSSLGELADRIRRRFKLAGADYTISTACTASANALVYADALVRSGRAKFALVMGVETFNIITALGFHGLSLLAPNGMRPFDRARSGIVLGEGCSALVVGRKRGAARFHLRGSANLCDIFGMSTANPDGSTVSGVIKMALASAGVGADRVLGVKAHGTASLLNDEAEAAGMRQVFDRLPLLSALKPFIGHTFGACGLNELILFTALLDRGSFPATPGVCAEPSDLDISLPQTPPPIAPGIFMLNYFGFGGNNTSLVVPMSMPEIIVRAAGDYYAPVADAPPDVRALTKDVTGKPVRRVGRFIQLGLVGAARCVGDAELAPDTAVYLTSRRGDLEVTIEVMEALFRDGHAPKPLSFINTVSNAACYYIARHFELHGRSCFVGGGRFGFETALDLAMLEMRAGLVRSALVGCVEIATDPLTIHRRRLGLAADAPVAEASHWLWLTAAAGVEAGSGQPRSGENRLGAVAAVEVFSAAAELRAWWQRQAMAQAATAFAAGQFLAAADAAAIQRELGLTEAFNYRDERGYYDCQSGALVGAFLRAEGSGAAAVLHVNAEPGGRLAVMLARR